MGSAESGVKALRMAKEIDSQLISNFTLIDKSKNFPAYFDFMARLNSVENQRFKGGWLDRPYIEHALKLIPSSSLVQSRIVLWMVRFTEW